MNTFKILIKFKDKQTLEIEAEADVDPREVLQREWLSNKQGMLMVGNYAISMSDVLWIKVEGEKLEPIRE